ncbi:MAG: hypothetical protein FWE71_08100 [Nocardioidaceae bacterium]|nr:hypothetical protein [Nocardioidaceae bacterium]MCL2613166.1 hypothetical protein [Nocardioidaceae bacterium]
MSARPNRAEVQSRSTWSLYRDVVWGYFIVYVVAGLVLRGRVDRDDGGLIVPLGLLSGAVLVTEWRGWDRSRRVRSTLVVIAVVGALAIVVAEAVIG